MHASTVYPQNYAVNTVEEAGNRQNIPQHQDTNCTPTKRCIRFFIITIVILLIIISAIAIPLAIITNSNNNTNPLTTISTPENATTNMETITSSNTAKKTDRTTIDSSVTASDNATILTSKEITASTVSSVSNTELVVSTSASTDNVSTNTNETVGVDTSTNMKSFSSEWTNNKTSTNVSNTKATDKTPTTASTMSLPTTTTSRLIIPLNQMNDTIIGLYNTVAGGPNGDEYLATKELPQHAMDGITRTKYYNDKSKPGSSEGAGIGTGFVVIPSARKPTVACSLRFATGNDMPNRDPITVTLEGSNVTNITELNCASSWTLIYNGPTGIDAINEHNRSTYGTPQNLKNEKPFISYRLLVTSKRNATSDAVQYSEAQIINDCT